MSPQTIYCTRAAVGLLYYRKGVGFWNDSGCRTIAFENGSVMCSCNHLTHFAILLSPDMKLVRMGIGIHKLESHHAIIIFTPDFSNRGTNSGNSSASPCVHFTGVPAGYYSRICTSKVSQSILLYIHYLLLLTAGHCGLCVTTFTVCCVVVCLLLYLCL